MKDRLLQLLDLEQLSPSRFADLIGVQRSSVSHVLSGRNNPSFDFLQKTLKAFPGLKADWLIQGTGSMYDHMRQEAAEDLFSTQPGPVPDDQVIADTEEEKAPENAIIPGDDLPAPEYGLENATEKGEKEADPKLVQVVLIYDDNTFSSYKAAE